MLYVSYSIQKRRIHSSRNPKAPTRDLAAKKKRSQKTDRPSSSRRDLTTSSPAPVQPPELYNDIVSTPSRFRTSLHSTGLVLSSLAFAACVGCRLMRSRHGRGKQAVWASYPLRSRTPAWSSRVLRAIAARVQCSESLGWLKRPST